MHQSVNCRIRNQPPAALFDLLRKHCITDELITVFETVGENYGDMEAGAAILQIMQFVLQMFQLRQNTVAPELLAQAQNRARTEMAMHAAAEAKEMIQMIAAGRNLYGTDSPAAIKTYESANKWYTAFERGLTTALKCMCRAMYSRLLVLGGARTDLMGCGPTD